MKVETLDEFRARGGKITKCAKNRRTKLPEDRKQKAGTPERLKEVLSTGCPCCGGKVARAKNRWNGHFAVCTNEACPVRSADGKDYYSVSSTHEFNYEKLMGLEFTSITAEG